MRNWKKLNSLRPITGVVKKSRSLPSQAKALKVTGNKTNWKESDIQKAIMDYLKVVRVEAAVTNADRTWGKGGGVRQSKVPKGHPDITAILSVLTDAGLKIGLAFYVEVKTPTGRLSDEQKVRLLSLADAGAICLVARSVEDVSSVITRYKGKVWTAEAKVYMDRLLQLSISDRRNRDVRQALVEMTDKQDNGNKPDNK